MFTSTSQHIAVLPPIIRLEGGEQPSETLIASLRAGRLHDAVTFARILDQEADVKKSWINFYYLHPESSECLGAIRESDGHIRAISSEEDPYSASVETFFEADDLIVSVTTKDIRQLGIFSVGLYGEDEQRFPAWHEVSCAGVKSFEAKIPNARIFGVLSAIFWRE